MSSQIAVGNHPCAYCIARSPDRNAKQTPASPTGCHVCGGTSRMIDHHRLRSFAEDAKKGYFGFHVGPEFGETVAQLLGDFDAQAVRIRELEVYLENLCKSRMMTQYGSSFIAEISDLLKPPAATESNQASS